MGKETIVLGGGCFWCTESVFSQIQGVTKVESGYSGGHIKNPSYKEVCTGMTGHVEVIKVWFEPEVVSLHTLLSIFFTTHNPTTLNRQGNDIGTQYRSVIFYADHTQQEIAEKVMKEIDSQNIYDKPIITEISPLINFYRAEQYHHNYFANNPDEPYCEAVISPKIAKFRAHYKHLLKG
ncbi:MAG: peptide-methionine (S)-S-oxide reductase MsrA [Bacteroidia bacterium]|nr:peptide-methionine (S)-S-oxide reductase MsrA [Bacteroidia bacterium]MCO5254091.1 peptide-methionine (S)-S-oxide reductase MsrA [Bacteroidota bacterium]MCZ2129550.1 peptide-methionine (S)-S-oxide reductase MsrA [Bacteroidia bacterium]